MQFLDKKLTRFLFVQFVFSNFFVKTELLSVVQIFTTDDEKFLSEFRDIARVCKKKKCNHKYNLDYDSSYLTQLTDLYSVKKSELITKMFAVSKYGSTLNIQIQSVILSALLDFYLTKELKLIISEYLNIADMLGIEGNIIHATIDNVTKQLATSE